jgi:hypothetical protein
MRRTILKSRRRHKLRFGTRIVHCNKSACGPRLAAFFRRLGMDRTRREARPRERALLVPVKWASKWHLRGPPYLGHPPSFWPPFCAKNRGIPARKISSRRASGSRRSSGGCVFRTILPTRSAGKVPGFGCRGEVFRRGNFEFLSAIPRPQCCQQRP